MMLVLLVSGCGSVRISEQAACDGTLRYRNAHADALLDVGVPDRVVISGAALIASLDAACGDIS